MGIEDHIPELKEEHRDLLILLRAAVNGVPSFTTEYTKYTKRGQPPAHAPSQTTLRRINWPAVIELARLHQVDMFLYPAIVQWQARQKGSSPECFPEPALMARWRNAFFGAVAKYERASRQLKELLGALHEAQVRVIPLKGAWLAEKIYDEGAQRPMCDLDLLVPLEQLGQARTVFETLGYTTPDHYFDTSRDKDIHYRHPSHPKLIELHFRIWHEVKTNVVAPNTERLWVDPIEDTLHGIPILTFPPERQIVYVAQHILYSSMNIPLRAYLDLILLARSTDFDASKLENEATALGVPFGAKFVIQVALDIAGVEPTEGLAAFLNKVGRSVPTPPRTGGTPVPTPNEKERLLALRSILEMTGASAQIRPEIADSQQGPFIEKLRIAWGVVFKPAGFIRSAYPKAVARFGLPGGYWARLQDVARRSSTTRRKNREDDPTLELDLQNFSIRRELCGWLLEKDQMSR